LHVKRISDDRTLVKKNVDKTTCPHYTLKHGGDKNEEKDGVNSDGSEPAYCAADKLLEDAHIDPETFNKTSSAIPENQMNPFVIAVITLFTLAGFWELAPGGRGWWMAIFYFCSAIINIAAVRISH